MHMTQQLMWIIGSEKDIAFYDTYFRRKDHINYIGEEESKLGIGRGEELGWNS